MGQVSPFLRKFKGGYGHYCPGCKGIHVIYTEPPAKVCWSFNGNVERPTFGPSVRLSKGDHTECHYFIIDGQIQFCDDSDHEMKGQTVPLPPLPDQYSDANYGWPE